MVTSAFYRCPVRASSLCFSELGAIRPFTVEETDDQRLNKGWKGVKPVSLSMSDLAPPTPCLTSLAYGLRPRDPSVIILLCWQQESIRLWSLGLGPAELLAPGSW